MSLEAPLGCPPLILKHKSFSLHHEAHGDTAMAKDKEPCQSLAGIAEQTVQQFTERTQRAMEQYFSLLQSTMSALPWSNTNLNRILLSHATKNVTATFAFMQKLSEAKNFQEVLKIQTEFMEKQLQSFNEQTKTVGEIYTKAAADAMKTPFGGST